MIAFTVRKDFRGFTMTQVVGAFREVDNYKGLNINFVCEKLATKYPQLNTRNTQIRLTDTEIDLVLNDGEIHTQDSYQMKDGAGEHNHLQKGFFKVCPVCVAEQEAAEAASIAVHSKPAPVQSAEEAPIPTTPGDDVAAVEARAAARRARRGVRRESSKTTTAATESILTTTEGVGDVEL